MTLSELQPHIQNALAQMQAWRSSFGEYQNHESLHIAPDVLESAFATYITRLTEGNYPFFHPCYAGQMLKPPHPVAMLGYLTAMTINPNNHALDGGPPTAAMEKEVIQQLAKMFRFPQNTLGHLTSSGTIANLEALWISRQLHPNKKIAFSTDAHYTHERMCEVLGVETVKIPTDLYGKMDINALENALHSENIGTVVATTGTTGLGVLDPLPEIVALSKKYGFRIHVDAAYGGFFALLADENIPLSDEKPQRFSKPLRFDATYQAIAECDSVVIDPHKHGLQPYGCGCVLFRDANVGHFYKHDSPYTYFTSTELHLGEISLECSRAGAAAGALWLTLQCLPLSGKEGLGNVLKACLNTAQHWAQLLETSDEWQCYQAPELDIVSYFPEAPTTAEVDRLSQAIFETAMNRTEQPIFLSVYRVPSEKLVAKFPHIEANTPFTRILRSVMMKPEQAHFVTELHAELTAILREVSVSFR